MVTEVLGSLGGMAGGEGGCSVERSVTGGGGGRLRRKLATEVRPPPFTEVLSCGGDVGESGGSVIASPGSTFGPFWSSSISNERRCS